MAIADQICSITRVASCADRQSAGAEQVLESELVEPHEAVSAGADRVGIEVLERRAVREQVRVALARVQRRLATAPRRATRRAPPAPPGPRGTPPRAPSGAGTCACWRRPRPRRRRGPRCARACSRSGAARRSRAPRAGRRARTPRSGCRARTRGPGRTWPRTARSSRCGTACPCHSACATACAKLRFDICSCPTSGFTPTMSWCSSVEMNASAWPTVGQQDVPARLVRLGLDGEAQRVAAVDHVVREEVEPLAIALQRGRDVLGRRGTRHPRARPRRRTSAAPSSAARSRLRITLRSAKRRTERSLDVNPPSLKTGCENRFVVTIGTTSPVSSNAALKRAISRSRSPDVGPERDQVVVVERHAPRAELGEPVDGVDRVDRRARRGAERIARPASRRSRGRTRTCPAGTARARRRSGAEQWHSTELPFDRRDPRERGPRRQTP